MSVICVKTNVLDIGENNNLNFLKCNLKDLIITKYNLEINKYSDLSDKRIYLALQPIFDFNDRVIYYQIVARTHNNEKFPFDWYKELSKEDEFQKVVKDFFLTKCYQ